MALALERVYCMFHCATWSVSLRHVVRQVLVYERVMFLSLMHVLASPEVHPLLNCVRVDLLDKKSGGGGVCAVTILLIASCYPNRDELGRCAPTSR